MKLYLAGPMTGIKDFNFPMFDSVTTELREKGYEVFNPAENDRDNGYDGKSAKGDPAEAESKGFDLRTALKQDLAWICDHAAGIALLPYWENSKGAKAEVALAHALGLPAKLWVHWPPLEVPVEAVVFEPGLGFVVEEVA